MIIFILRQSQKKNHGAYCSDLRSTGGEYKSRLDHVTTLCKPFTALWPCLQAVQTGTGEMVSQIQYKPLYR